MDNSLIILDRESLLFRLPEEEESMLAESRFTISMNPKSSPPKIIFKIETTFERCSIQPPLGILLEEIPSQKILVSLKGKTTTSSERIQIEVIAAPVPSKIVVESSDDLDELWSSVIAKAEEEEAKPFFKTILPCTVKEWEDEETREYTLKEEPNDEEQEERVPGEGGTLKEEFQDEKAGLLQEMSGKDMKEKELEQGEKDVTKKEKISEEEILKSEEERENELDEELEQGEEDATKKEKISEEEILKSEEERENELDEGTGVENISTNVLETKLTDMLINEEEQEQRAPGEEGMSKEEFQDEKAGFVQEMSGKDMTEKELEQEEDVTKKEKIGEEEILKSEEERENELDEELEQGEEDATKKEKIGEEEILKSEEEREDELDEGLQQKGTGVENISTNVLETKLTDEEDMLINEERVPGEGGILKEEFHQDEKAGFVLQEMSGKDMMTEKVLEQEAGEKEGEILNERSEEERENELNEELEQEEIEVIESTNVLETKLTDKEDIDEIMNKAKDNETYISPKLKKVAPIIKELEFKVVELTAESDVLEKEIDELLKMLEKEAMDKKMQQEKDLKGEKNLEEEKVNLRHAIKRKVLENKLETLQRETKKLTDEIDALLNDEQEAVKEENKVILLETRNKELEYKIEELERENETLKKDLVELEQEKLMSYILDDDVTDSEYEDEERTMENEDLKSEVPKKIKVEESKDNENQAADTRKDLKYEIKELKKEYMELNEEIDNLSRMQHEKEIMLIQANAITKEYVYEIKGLRRENNYLKTEISLRKREAKENMANQAQAMKKEMESVVEKLKVGNADLKGILDEHFKKKTQIMKKQNLESK